MATFFLSRDAGGWRHFADGKPIYCGTFLEAYVGGEWVLGRYEAIDLHRGERGAKGYLVLTGNAQLDLAEGMEVRFPKKESLGDTSL